MAEMKLAGADAVDAAALDALRRHTGPKTEPHLVAAIFRDQQVRAAIVGAVDSAWRAVAVRTVFVHLTPKVSFSCANGPCELGDALVVYREHLRVGQRRRQAVLFQAKMWRGSGREWVKTDPDQHALYRHWPPFTIAGGPAREIRLPPGDYGRVLGMTAGFSPHDVPRVSPRRPTQPGCTRDDPVWSETMGTLGRSVRGLVRFEIGEKVEADWAATVLDMIRRVGPTAAGPTFPAGHRGGAAVRRIVDSEAADPAATDLDGADDRDPIEELDTLLDGAADMPPEDDVTFDEGDSPLSIMLIDVEENG